VSKKLPARPAWHKKTDFWIAAALILLGFFGLIKGDAVIRDPGQKSEGHLYVWYFLGGLAMFVNGWISHRQAMRLYEEATEGAGSSTAETREPSAPEPETPAEHEAVAETDSEIENK
jgi:hypothetical protein